MSKRKESGQTVPRYHQQDIHRQADILKRHAASAGMTQALQLQVEDAAQIQAMIEGTMKRFLRAMARKIKRRYGNSRHTPHQGAQECARRMRQGINGTQYVHGAQYR